MRKTATGDAVDNAQHITPLNNNLEQKLLDRQQFHQALILQCLQSKNGCLSRKDIIETNTQNLNTNPITITRLTNHKNFQISVIKSNGILAIYCVSKNDTDVAHYNFNEHQLILIKMLLKEYAIER